MPDVYNTAAAIQSPTDFVQKVYPDAMLVARDNLLMDRLVTTFGDRTGVAPRVSSEYSAASVASVAEDADMESQAFTPSALSTLTPAEVGAQFMVTDLRAESDTMNVLRDAALELGQALATKIETDLVGDFASFTGGTVGVAGSALTWGRFFAAAAQLRAQKAAGPVYAVLHPYHIHDLAKEASVAGANVNAPNFGDEVMRMRYFAQAAGVQIFESANITAGTAAVAGMFVPTALGLDIRRAARIEPERDASRRGTELNLSAVYAHGVWRPKFGIKIIANASVPTS